MYASRSCSWFDVVMPMYTLIKYSDNHSKTSGTLWKFYIDEPTLNDNAEIIDFTVVKSITDFLK